MSFFRSKRHGGKKNVYYRTNYRRWDFMREARQCIVSVIGPHMSSKKPVLEFENTNEVQEGAVSGTFLTTKIELPVQIETTGRV